MTPFLEIFITFILTISIISIISIIVYRLQGHEEPIEYESLTSMISNIIAGSNKKKHEEKK